MGNKKVIFDVVYLENLRRKYRLILGLIFLSSIIFLLVSLYFTYLILSHFFVDHVAPSIEDLNSILNIVFASFFLLALILYYLLSSSFQKKFKFLFMDTFVTSKMSDSNYYPKAKFRFKTFIELGLLKKSSKYKLSDEIKGVYEKTNFSSFGITLIDKQKYVSTDKEIVSRKKRYINSFVGKVFVIEASRKIPKKYELLIARRDFELKNQELNLFNDPRFNETSNLICYTTDEKITSKLVSDGIIDKLNYLSTLFRGDITFSLKKNSIILIVRTSKGSYKIRLNQTISDKFVLDLEKEVLNISTVIDELNILLD
ncbi:MAG: DUF3137 domain-containing protein [Acholeplasmatales bacterium]|jgi:hypothetical protein|nr:DUF3137 domain-containing protein [Acholeplasmatales bacterium]